MTSGVTSIAKTLLGCAIPQIANRKPQTIEFSLGSPKGSISNNRVKPFTFSS
jgi:hypothetical protein